MFAAAARMLSCEDAARRIQIDNGSTRRSPRTEDVAAPRSHVQPLAVKPRTSSASPPPSSLVSRLNHYKETSPPDVQQLKTAHEYFAGPGRGASYLFTAAHFRDMPADSTAAEIAFLGRSNVGKSSLLNALLNRTAKPLAFTSSKAGRTRAMQVFGVGQAGVAAGHAAGGTRKLNRDGMSATLPPGNSRTGTAAAAAAATAAVRLENWIGRGGVAIVDMPGYGYRSQTAWGVEAAKYLRQRRQLRRAFVLVDAEHGVLRTDLEVLRLLREAGAPHQIVMNKVDKLFKVKKGTTVVEKLERGWEALERRRKEVCNRAMVGVRGATVLGDVLAVSSQVRLRGDGVASELIGVEALRWAILQAAGLVDGVDAGERTSELAPLDAVGEHEGVVPWSPVA